ncbi:MAG: ABC transporter ATP-binding protein [Lachnospiraceae bacterium]|nr:ABC transporter ATP-binding protein [Lachnospiraceae bacterium]
MEKKKFLIFSSLKSGRLKEMWRQTCWIYVYVKRYWIFMIIYTLLGFVGTGVGIISSWISKNLVDIITGHETGAVVATFALMIGFGIGSTIINLITDYISSFIQMKVDAEIKSDIFEKIMVTDWESLTGYHTGDLLARWSGDAGMVSSGVLNFIPNLLIYVGRFISSLAVVVYYDWTFAGFALMGMPVSLILSRKLMRRMMENNKKSMEMGAKLSGFNQETFSNIQTIKAFSLVRLYVERLRQLQKEHIRMQLDFKKMSIWTSIILSVAGLAVTYSSYGWGIYRVWSGVISYGTMTMFLSLSGSLTGALHSLTSLVPTSIRITTSAGRLMDILEMPREDYSRDEEVDKLGKRHSIDGIGICLEDIRYSYLNGNQVFDGASLKAHPHEIIGLVGPSGEGKTTLMRLILSIVNPKAGKGYLHGGNNLSKDEADIIPLCASTRKLFSYVPQGNTMLSGTIAENMRFVKPDATDEEIWAALDMACAKEFVEKMPNGINSELKERGGGISEGQAQRLSIARAIIRKSPLLLLDEATSALDVATERKVLKNIMKDEYPRTLIVTTHRPTVLSACTRVYAIKDKKCVILNDEEIDEMVRGF